MKKEKQNGNISKPMLPTDWRGLSDTPPDELVEVIDSKGNKALAYPTWYPFKVVPNSKKIGKWTSHIVPCEPYWDGGWLIECAGLSNSIETVVGWKPISHQHSHLSLTPNT
jgi:hypothetical protein